MKITGFYVRNGKVVKPQQVLKYTPVVLGGALTLKTTVEVMNYLWLMSIAFDPTNPVSMAFRCNPELLKPILDSPVFQEMLSNPDLPQQMSELVKSMLFR